MDGLGGAGGGGGAGAGAGAAAQQDLNAVQGLLSFRPTLFRGNKKTDTITIEAWCGTISKAALSANWDDQRTLDCATENLRDSAAIWYANAKNGFRAEQASVTTTWDLFKTTICARFALGRTAIQKVNLIRDLTIAQNEDVNTFYERVYMSVRKSQGNPIQEMLARGDYNDADAAADPVANCRNAFADGIEWLQRGVIKVLFMAGLKDDMRSQLQAAPDFEDLTLEQVRLQAVRIEDSKEKEKRELPRQIIAALGASSGPDSQEAGILDQFKAMQRELQQINALTKSGPKKDKAKKKRKPLSDTPIHQRTRWMRCHRCNQWGLHMARECTLSAPQVANLTPADEKTPPGGMPADRQFPAPN